jgi:type II secretory pathway component GspD/PulD (secretin)
VALDLDAEFKILSGQGSGGLPIISNRKLVTQICIPNGEWAMIAGLLSTSEARTIVGLPIKGIPGTRQRNSAATEVLVLIRTHLLALSEEERAEPPIALGSETRPRAPL